MEVWSTISCFQTSLDYITLAVIVPSVESNGKNSYAIIGIRQNVISRKHDMQYNYSICISSNIRSNNNKIVYFINIFINNILRVGIVQSVYRRVTGWKAGIRFPTGKTDFFLLHSFQYVSGPHPAHCPMDTGALSLGVKRVKGKAIPGTGHGGP
jgi:hypothetical protein